MILQNIKTLKKFYVANDSSEKTKVKGFHQNQKFSFIESTQFKMHQSEDNN